ncbi:MAG: hypothetical protein ABIK83_04100 [Candidatus Zixiibacteriota bacterium]
MRAGMSGLTTIKGMRSTGQRSIPRVQGSTYLDLYMSAKEKERLEKEISNIDKRRQDLERKLDSVNDRIDRSRKPEAARTEKVSKESGEPCSVKERKTMSVSY